MTEEEERQDNLAAMKREEELKRLRQEGLKQALARVDVLGGLDVVFTGAAIVRRGNKIIGQRER